MILTRQRPSRRPATLVGLALAGLALTGCGASLGIHPGSAVVVGDRTASMQHVDSTSSLYCKAYLPTIQQQSSGGSIPMRYIRQFVAASMTERLIGEQLAEQYGVTPASGYAQHQAQVQQQFSQLPQDQLNAVLDVEGGDPYLQNVQVAVGQQLTGNSGEATADIKHAQQRGLVATQDWLNAHTVAVDPALGVAIKDGKVTGVRDQTSYPVSALAVSGAQNTGQADPSYTAALTPSQLCG
ncbi:MAG: hypothetical protein J2P22_17255 [Nocardioides sp.]|nr:hypothetical protein [Nocardioides sp.]